MPSQTRLTWQPRAWLPGAVALAAIWLLAFASPLVTQDIFRFPHSIDWDVYVEASRRIGSPNLYVWPGGWEWCDHCVFRYSPIFAWIIGLIAPTIGLLGWRLLHFAVLPILGWPLGILVLASWPFWQDVQVGNVVTFALVAGVAAMRGSRLGSAVYFLISLLAPRPFLLPLFLWLLWKRPEWRLPVVALALAQLALMLLLGYAADWVRLILSPNSDFAAFYDYGPARLLGPWWIAVGAALCAWLVWKGRVGLASLAIQPYWLGYYLLMVFLELWNWLRVPEAASQTGRSRDIAQEAESRTSTPSVGPDPREGEQ